jgi:hypothetical protein
VEQLAIFWVSLVEDRFVEQWAAVLGFTLFLTDCQGSGNFSCLEYKGCSSERRIMRCFYDGGHMDLPEDGIADQVTLW